MISKRRRILSGRMRAHQITIQFRADAHYFHLTIAAHHALCWGIKISADLSTELLKKSVLFGMPSGQQSILLYCL